MNLLSYISYEIMPWILGSNRYPNLQDFTHQYATQEIIQAHTHQAKFDAPLSGLPSSDQMSNAAEKRLQKILRRGAHLDEVIDSWHLQRKIWPTDLHLPQPKPALVIEVATLSLVHTLARFSGLFVSPHSIELPEDAAFELEVGQRTLLDNGASVYNCLRLMAKLYSSHGHIYLKAIDDRVEGRVARMLSDLNARRDLDVAQNLLQITKFHLQAGHTFQAQQSQAGAIYALSRSPHPHLAAEAMSGVANTNADTQDHPQLYALHKAAAQYHRDPIKRADSLHDMALLSQRRGNLQGVISNLRAEINELESNHHRELAGDRWFSLATLLYSSQRYRESESAARQAHLRLSGHRDSLDEVLDLRLKCLRALGEYNRANQLLESASASLNAEVYDAD